MSDLHDRFERLARRGTLRGADVVLTEARRLADDSGAIVGVDEGASGDDTRSVISPINLEAVSVARKQRRFGALVTAGGVAASLFVGVLAIGSITGSGGGANSPEGAVRQLADAVSHEDALAAADVLAPEEVRSLRGTVDAASKRAQELALAESASAPLNGLDLSVDGLALSTESLADGYAKVTVAGGTISARTDKARFSPLVQRALRNSDDNRAEANLATLGRDENLPTFVVTVQRDGHWYVSAAYTTLEYIRVVNHLPAADFGSGQRAIATLGADSPDAAVTDAMQALAHNDWEKLISLAPPEELPVYDYRAALTELAADSPTNFTIDKLDTTSTVNGDTAKVILKASGHTPPDSGGDSGTWSVDGSCFQFPEYTVGVESNMAGSSLSDSNSITLTPTGRTCGLGALYFFPTSSTLETGKSDDITVVRKSGRWFVSPVGTVLDLLDREIAGITRRTLYTYLNVPDQLPPDGVLTLGQPVTLPSSTDFGSYVYTFEGHEGERLLGLSDGPGANGSPQGIDVEVRIFGPDGNELDNAQVWLGGEPVQLPSDGTYKFAVRSYYGSGLRLTIWDEADAPDAAKHLRYPQPTDTCTPSTDVAQVCTPQIDRGSATATTVPRSPSSSSASSTSVPGG